MISQMRRLRLQVRVALDSLYLWLFVRPSKRPDPIDIPVCFANFVEKFGGEVSDRTPQIDPVQKQNADYIFRAENIIAELKCLEADPFGNSRSKSSDL